MLLLVFCILTYNNLYKHSIKAVAFETGDLILTEEQANISMFNTWTSINT